MFAGVLAGLFCGALWGLTFVAPRAVAPFTAFDFSVLRYGFFGVLAVAAMLAVPRFRPVGLGRRRLAIGIVLGGVAYNGYFLCIAYAVRYAGAAIPPLIVGTLPVVLAVIGNWRDGTIAWRRLAGPLGLIAAGVLAVNVGAVVAAPAHAPENLPLGTVFAVMALGLWVWYGLANSSALGQPDRPPLMAWTGVQGAGSILGSVALLPLTSPFAPDFHAAAIPADRWTNFIVWSLFMGFAASWLATILWTQASRRLPVALVAQLIVSETVFGLFFGFLWEGRGPTRFEAAGILLQVVGVIAAIAVFTGRRGPALPVATPDVAT